MCTVTLQYVYCKVTRAASSCGLLRLRIDFYTLWRPLWACLVGSLLRCEISTTMFEIFLRLRSPAGNLARTVLRVFYILRMAVRE
jgi:hypothetical protein